MPDQDTFTNNLWFYGCLLLLDIQEMNEFICKMKAVSDPSYGIYE